MLSEIEFRPEGPRNDPVALIGANDVVSIGRSLASTCHSPAHLTMFYSVAQHNVLLSRIVHPHLALQALIAPPPSYARKFGHPDVHRADQILQAAIQRDLMPASVRRLDLDNDITIAQMPSKIVPADPEDAFQMFLARYRLLAYQQTQLIQVPPVRKARMAA
ncbi:hypothetical protein [Hydrogenophaga sp. 2FB]|uniref:hypothetical protein n=1 Tax=Hydrogenophaga sp. 2FB TaxID=2502187 RepID=UPI0010F9875D|nr:hypothetical protein [Hydrogenophaga sp. 2FB]